MLVSKQFLRDFAYIANLYGWNAEDVEDAKAQTRTHPELRSYWTKLAAAHRAGYQQTRENNFMRLGQWLQMQGGTAGALVSTAAETIPHTSPEQSHGCGQLTALRGGRHAQKLLPTTD